MRIGFFTDSYQPYTSGVVRSIDTFAHHLRQAGHQVYIFAPRYHKVGKEPFVYRFLSVPSPTNQEFSIPIPISIQTGKTIKQLGLDVIHVHSPFMLGTLGAMMARRFNLPLVMTYHTLYDQYVHYLPFARGASQWVIRRYLRDYCNKCDLVVVPTAVIGEILDAGGVRVPIKAIPTGIELDEYSKGNPNWLKETFGVEDQKTVLLSVGRLGPEKNISFLLQSFAHIHAEIKTSTLVLVGSGAHQGEYERLASDLGISDSVIFTGKLNRQEVINCYSRANLFVFASVTETQGIVLAEAKAAGVPVVAIDAFGTREMIIDGEDGILVPENEEKFVQATIDLLRDKPRHDAMTRRALLNAPMFSAQESASKLIMAYEEVCATTPSRPREVS